MRRHCSAMVVACVALACVAPPTPAADAALPAADAGCTGGGDGYGDPPGSGVAWIIDRIEMAADGEGLDVTGDGVPDTAINRAFGFYRFAVNGALRNTIENGRVLYLLEVAGLCAPYRGDDPAVTAKVYSCQDANSDPADNFCRDPGCGAMRVDDDHQEWTADGQSINRTPPTAVSGFQLNAPLSGAVLIEADDTTGFNMTDNWLALTIPERLDEIPDGWLCGAVTARDLNRVLPPHESDPECRTLCWPDSAPEGLSVAAYLAWRGYQPDRDLDGDGLERYAVNASQQVVHCYDGPRSVAAPGRWQAECLLDPRMADGFSICFGLHALRGQLQLE